MELNKDRVIYIEKVKVNLKFYSGVDQYSDGDIEKEILEIFKNNIDINEILSQDNRWPVLYHLAPQRRNLLEWYSFKDGSTVLEIGAGCGALTGLLCEKNNSVVCIELSKRRAEIIAHRNAKKDNLEIIVGNINKIILDREFDYITLIGVLEYANRFTDTLNPVEDFLLHIKKYLKKDGILIIAIENKFGLKYWSGAAEDHTGRFFESIEDYPNNTDVITFGKEEIRNILKDVGFHNLDFYYPIPDYKLPIHIFSDNYLPSIGQIPDFIPNYDRERYKLFNEKLVYNNIIKNKCFDLFANSFLVFCK